MKTLLLFTFLHSLFVQAYCRNFYFIQTLDSYVFPTKRALPIFTGGVTAFLVQFSVAALAFYVVRDVASYPQIDWVYRFCCAGFIGIIGVEYFRESEPSMWSRHENYSSLDDWDEAEQRLDRDADNFFGDPLSSAVKHKSFVHAVRVRFGYFIANPMLWALNTFGFGALLLIHRDTNLFWLAGTFTLSFVGLFVLAVFIQSLSLWVFFKGWLD